MEATKPKRIVVAEDNPALSGVIRFNLKRAGFDAIDCRNGKEAWDTIQEHGCDLLLTDHQMPQMSGVELLQALRANPETEQIPAIILTAKGLELDLEQIRVELGVLAALPKPFSPAELISLVESCFESTPVS